MPRKRWYLGLWLVLGSCPLAAQVPKEGLNVPLIEGKAQNVYLYPGAPALRTGLKVLYVPGDAGMWGPARTMAQQMAKWGYDVFGLDTKDYLESFTDNTALKEPRVMDHFHQLAQWVAQGDSARIALVGWSEGAGLGLLAASAAQNKQLFSGLIAIGLSEASELGWRWQDDITYITKADPDEPEFPSAPYMPQVAPLPLLMIQSTHDVYVSAEAAQQLFALARDPKRFSLLRAKDHRFSDNTEEFYQVLHDGLQWLAATSP